MGATVDWGVVIRFFAEATGVFLVLLGLTWWAWLRYWQRIRWHLQCRRYWREHPNYEPRHWQMQGRPHKRKDPR